MVNLHYRLKVELGTRKNEIFAAARQSILKLVALQSLVAKCRNIRKI